MIEKWYNELSNKFENIKCMDYVVMPNHFHCLIYITDQNDTKIGDVVRWFKTMTTNDYIKGTKDYNWPRFNKHLWQRDYYDNIIRDEEMLFQIQEYIRTNPEKWNEDKLKI